MIEYGLIRFIAVFRFYTPWKRKKTKRFLKFLEDIEMDY